MSFPSWFDHTVAYALSKVLSLCKRATETLQHT